MTRGRGVGGAVILCGVVIGASASAAPPADVESSEPPVMRSPEMEVGPPPPAHAPPPQPPPSPAASGPDAGPSLEDYERSADRKAKTFVGIAAGVHAVSVVFHFLASVQTREFGSCAGRFEAEGPCEAETFYALGYGTFFALSWAQAGAGIVLSGIGGANYGKRDLLRAGLMPSTSKGRRFRIAGGTLVGLSLVGFAISRGIAIQEFDNDEGLLCGADVACRIAFRESTFWVFSAGAMVGAGLLGYGIKRDRGLKSLRGRQATVGLAPMASPQDGTFGLAASGKF